MSWDTGSITETGEKRGSWQPKNGQKKRIRCILLYTKNYLYKDVLEHNLRFQAALQLIHLHSQKEILGGEIFNLFSKKKLRFPRPANQGGLLHLLLKRIGAYF